MSYAVRNDGLGFRSVAGPGELQNGETYSQAIPVLTIPPHPDVDGFIQSLKDSLGGVLQANLLLRQYPAFIDALTLHEWGDVAILVNDAHASGVLDSAQLAAIAGALNAHHLPVVL